MNCEHTRKWEMTEADDLDSINELLEIGYEPFSVTISPLGEDRDGYTYGGDTTYYFKRLKPCDLCEKV